VWKERVYNREERKKETFENGKELSHSAHANGMNEFYMKFHKNLFMVSGVVTCG
jgi:hypothetical protein